MAKDPTEFLGMNHKAQVGVAFGICAAAVLRGLHDSETPLSPLEIFCVVGFCVGMGLLITGLAKARLLRRIRTVAPSKIRSLSAGTVGLSGRAKAHHKALIDPVYGQPCVYFSVEIQEHQGAGQYSYWTTVFKENSDNFPFYLEDETGQVLIIPNSADNQGGSFTSKSNYGNVFGKGRSTTGPEIEFMKDKGSRSGDKTILIRIIREQASLYIMGHCQPLPSNLRPGQGVSLRDAAVKLKKDKKRMDELDTNKDGQIDSFEWEAGLQKYKQELDRMKASQRTENPSSIFTSSLFVGKKPAAPFVIAENEKTLTQSSHQKSAWQLVAGPILTAVCAYLYKINFL